MSAYGGLQIAANTTAIIVGATAAKLTQGWAAITTPSQHGDQSVAASAANSRLTLKPGVYKIDIDLTIEGESDSGTSGDATGHITGQIYVAGSAVAGTKTKVSTNVEGELQLLHISALIEVTEAQRTAGTNYAEVYLSTTDALGNDVIISEGRFLAQRLS